MIGLVIIAHGDFGTSLLKATEHVVGPLNATSIEIGPSDNMEQKRQELKSAIGKSNVGSGVIVATDLFGGTPSNLATSCMNKDIEVVAGMNLPMLIRFAGVRENSLTDAIADIRDAGRKYISVASEVFGQLAQQRQVPPKREDTPHDRASQELDQIAESIAQLQLVLANSSLRAAKFGGIGHNLPPPTFTIEDNDVLMEGALAAQIASTELTKRQPGFDILRLCISALKRVLSLLKQLTLWTTGKIDVFATEAAKSTGKALGPAVIAAATVAGLSGRIVELVEYLRGVVGL